MVPSPLLSLLLFGSVGEVSASALFGRQPPPSDGATTLTLDKRQETALVTKFSTIFSGGDASNTRIALSGFDIRVDVANGAWGFCATNNPNQCDMAGTCFDEFSCSKGCGFENTALKTWTCSESNAGFCSTALLTLASDPPRAFTYLACGDKPRTEEYKAFTTSARPSTSSSPPAPLLPTPEQTSGTATQPGSTTALAFATGTHALNSASASIPLPTSSPDPPNNTTAIIGAVIGCVALICICVVVVFLIRRSRNASAAAAGGNTGGHDGAAPAAVASASWEYKAPLPPSAMELPGGSPAAYHTSWREPPVRWGEGYPAAAPVELPAAGGWRR